ncbi:MAG: hypothetical protein WC851_02610 [Candidatus Shapirobacteria bacterium]|jgi:hypothetical protein
MAIVVVGGGSPKEGAPKPAEVVKKVDAPASGGGNNGLVILTEERRKQPVQPGMMDDMAMGMRQALGEGEIYIAGNPLMELGNGYADGLVKVVTGALNTASNTVKGGKAVLRVGMEQAIENGASDAQRLGFREGGFAGLVGATIVEGSVRKLATMVRNRREKKQK